MIAMTMTLSPGPYATNKSGTSVIYFSFIGETALHGERDRERESLLCTVFTPAPSHTPQMFFSFSKALNDVFCFLGLFVELPEGVEELLHLSLQRRIVEFGGGSRSLRLYDLSFHHLVPVTLLGEVGFQPHHLCSQILVSLFQAEEEERRVRGKVTWSGFKLDVEWSSGL